MAVNTIPSIRLMLGPMEDDPAADGDDRSLKYEIGCLLDERFQFREGTVRPKIMSSISAPRPERRVELRKRKMRKNMGRI